MGAATRDQIDRTHKQMIAGYEDWVDRSKAKGEFTPHIPTQFAASYIDAMLGNAMSQQGPGEKTETIRDMLKMAFSVLVSDHPADWFV